MEFIEKKVSDFIHAFPTPSYFSFNPVAIDISPFSVRVMRLKNTNFGFIPEFFKEEVFDRPYDLTDQDATREEIEGIASVLKKIQKEYKLKYAIASLPEQKTYIYKTKLPQQAFFDLPSAIRFSLEENVPLSANDVNFDYFLINKDEKKGELEVIVNVFPKKVIEIYTKVLKKSGLIPISFQPESVSMSRALITPGDNKPYIIIRLMEDRTNVVTVENGQVQYTTSIFIGCEAIKKDLVKNGPAYKDLLSALYKVMVYWFTSKKNSDANEKIEDAIILGKYANYSELVEALERDLKIDVEIGNVWKNNFSTNDYIPALSKEESLIYGVTVGLAMKSINHQ